MTTLNANLLTLRNFNAKDQDGKPKFGMQQAQNLVGAGRELDGSSITMATRSSTRKALVPKTKGTTNPIYLIEFSDKPNLQATGFSLIGSEQGHLYNGIRIERCNKFEASELRIANIPGNSDINPGETFAMNAWQSDDVYIHDVEIDGGGIGASGLGYNSCERGRTVRFTGHDLKYCKAIALWQHKGGHVFEDFQSLNNAFGIGFERCDGVYLMKRPKFVNSQRADIHLASDTTRATVHIEDPILKPGQKIKVLLSKRELGRPNKQRVGDVQVFVGGKERPDLLLYVTRA